MEYKYQFIKNIINRIGGEKMKCIILAGGKGSRIRYYEDDYPKPLIKIGAHPIIWHIIKIYVSYGIKDFIICLGYKSYVATSFLGILILVVLFKFKSLSPSKK